MEGGTSHCGGVEGCNSRRKQTEGRAPCGAAYDVRKKSPAPCEVWCVRVGVVNLERGTSDLTPGDLSRTVRRTGQAKRLSPALATSLELKLHFLYLLFSSFSSFTPYFLSLSYFVDDQALKIEIKGVIKHSFLT
ncbi:hypothetical protein L6452_05014 [Arctium lappa]|uniref:Uncharacterized protein n=1 Tax=Arctium lappa TaxID=4217 RepID=A0ACB9EF86_ARCLA|nr:hypothetical protein L6452_05014 [Arctium lappa]